MVFLGFWWPSRSSFLQALGHMTREKAHNALQLLGLEGLSHLVSVDSHQRPRSTTQIAISRPEGAAWPGSQPQGPPVSPGEACLLQGFSSVLLEISGHTCHTADERQLPPHTWQPLRAPINVSQPPALHLPVSWFLLH